MNFYLKNKNVQICGTKLALSKMFGAEEEIKFADSKDIEKGIMIPLEGTEIIELPLTTTNEDALPTDVVWIIPKQEKPIKITVK